MSRRIVEEVGSLAAPIGSRSWALAMRSHIQLALKDTVSQSEHLQTMLDLFEQHDGWTQLEDRFGAKFRDFEAFCTCRPPHGLGYRRDAIDRILAERKEKEASERAGVAVAARRQGRPAITEEEKGRQSTLSGKRDSDYRVARIARDRPDILDRMKAGEFKSVRAAAIEAGIVKPTATLPLDLDGAVRCLRRHFRGADLARLVAALQSGAAP